MDKIIEVRKYKFSQNKTVITQYLLNVSMNFAQTSIMQIIVIKSI